MNAVEAAKLLKIIQGAYPRVEFTDENIDVYTMMLSDLPYKETGQAIKRLIATSKWPPTIAEIRREVTEMQLALPSPEQAWIEVQSAARSFCPYDNNQQIRFSHPLVRQAVRVMGGIEQIAYSNYSELTGQRFREVYERVAESAKRRYQSGEKALPFSQERKQLTEGWKA